MLWPKKNSYKEFDNEKKFLRLENSHLPPITFLMVCPLVAWNRWTHIAAYDKTGRIKQLVACGGRSSLMINGRLWGTRKLDYRRLLNIFFQMDSDRNNYTV